MSDQTLQETMARLRKEVASSNRPAGDPSELDRLQQHVQSLRDLEKEQRLYKAGFGGIDLTGEQRNNATVVGPAGDEPGPTNYWHGDLWRVECRSASSLPTWQPPCHGCGRTAVVRGDDVREKRVTSCQDFDTYGVTT